MKNAFNRFQAFKALAHFDKLKVIAEGNIPLPVTWVVYPTNKCVYECDHCIMKKERKNKSSLSTEVMSKICTDAVFHDIKTVIFSGGGEPLLHEELPTACELLAANGIGVGINTNGYLLLDKEFVKTSVQYLRISVDAASKETYDRVHTPPKDAWDKLNEAAEFLKDYPGELGLSFLVSRDNIGEVYDFCVFAQKFNPTFIHIRPVYTGVRNVEDTNYMQLLAKIGERVTADFENVFFKTDKFDGFWTPRDYDKCRATPLIAVTAADGAFLVCQDNFIRFGDYNTESFEDIWFGEKHRSALDKINMSECPRCVETQYNSIIQNCVLQDTLKTDLL